MKKIFLFLLFVFVTSVSIGQVGYGTVGGLDFYQRYENPVDDIAYTGSGNALLNIVFGPRVWLGGKKLSFSLESQINLGLTSFAIKDYKGIGALGIPVIAKINYKGLSGFYPGFASGFSLGFGIQWSKTELFYLSKDYKDIGVNRKFEKTYVFQIDLGVGSFGKSGYLYTRYGINFENDATVLNVGIVVSINKSFAKGIRENQKI